MSRTTPYHVYREIQSLVQELDHCTLEAEREMYAPYHVYREIQSLCDERACPVQELETEREMYAPYHVYREIDEIDDQLFL